RSADPVGRRRLKWVIFGTYLAWAPVLALALWVLAGFEPRGVLLVTVALSLWPICLLIAMVRYNLFDIDRLISSTASYSLLLIGLLGALLIAIPRIADPLGPLFGIDPRWAQSILALGCAAVVVPLNRRLRPQIERFFFAERYALERGVGDLLDEIPEHD